MPHLTPSQQQHARAMLRDRATFVNPGIPVALRTTMALMTSVLNQYGRGRRSFRELIRARLSPLVESLADGMATGYLMGARRAILHSGIRFQQQSEYNEALRFLQRRLKLDDAELGQVREFYRGPAVSVMENVSTNVDRALQRTMSRITAEGLHVREGKARLALAFEKLNLTPKHRASLEAIYRTQTQIAYSAGQWAYNEQPEIQEILWGYKYSAVGDERTREEHALLDGTTLPKDDPRWASIFPPNGWNCRCVAIEIYRKVEPVVPPEPIQRGKRLIVPGPDKNFEFNPGRLFDAIGKQQIAKRITTRLLDVPRIPIRRPPPKTKFPKSRTPRAAVEAPTWRITSNSAEARKQLKKVTGAKSVTAPGMNEAAKHRMFQKLGDEYVSLRQVIPATKDLKMDSFKAVNQLFKIRDGKRRELGGYWQYRARSMEVASKWTTDAVGPGPIGSRVAHANGSLRTIYRHEMGHGVHDQVIGFNTTAGQEWASLANSRTPSYWASNVTQYAATNEFELFCESFAHWGDRFYKRGTLPRVVESFMEKHLPRAV